MEHDVTLCRITHEETRAGFRITASMTRFGGFYVCVEALQGWSKPGGNWYPVWEGENVLQARAWVDLQARRAA